jgi:hypothetical protein
MRLLPYLDAQSVYNRLNLQQVDEGTSEPPTSTTNKFALQVHVAGFVCVEDDVPQGGNSYRICAGTSPGIHATWIRGRPINGPVESEALRGMFTGGRFPSRVLDGLSNTVLFSERVVGDGDLSRYGKFSDVAEQFSMASYPDEALVACAAITTVGKHASSVGFTWLHPTYLHTIYNHVLTPNAAIVDCAAGTMALGISHGAYTARSYHRGGVNCVMCDGAGRFVSQSIDLRVWRSLGSIDGGEAVQLVEF